ncbi:uncharacterized protein [Heterodontus francisci]|uniref:uncharacterized protein n=1 Tax=Heterodontus francisci TaxID=7792 RepID=UPI00355B5DE0
MGSQDPLQKSLFSFGLLVAITYIVTVTQVKGLKDNLFYQVHTKLYGNQTVCYPLARSVEALFVATPSWNPLQLYTAETSGQPCEGQEGRYKRSVQGRCVELIDPTHPNCRGVQGTGGTSCSKREDFPLCFTGQGWGCAYALVPKNATCVQRQCARQQCQIHQGRFSCTCDKERCFNATAGRQFICGHCNGTHVSSDSWSYPFDSHQMNGSNGRSTDPRNWWYVQFTQTNNKNITCYRAKRGFMFLLNGTYTTATPTLPIRFAVGAIGPLTVPCPQETHTRRRKVARAIGSDFCADWKDPITLGSSLGYGFLSALSLGGSAGVVAAKNRNYLICGLTILGNSTRRGLEAINRELSELRLYTQQTRYATDYLLAQQGGVCTIVGDKCITNVRDESLNITEAINAI